MDAYWRAANYLSVRQLGLYDNPLLKKPLVAGHWGTAPEQNFICVYT
jgi:xylulose-5-phosphate/fructose-6-phosphate phosphoketolase